MRSKLAAGLVALDLSDCAGRAPAQESLAAPTAAPATLVRQTGLLGEALAIVPGEPGAAAEAIAELLAEPRRIRMGSIGRERMGRPGGARAIASAVAALAA